MDKKQVIQILEELGTLLELKGENPFKARAYHAAARTLQGLSEEVVTLVEEERLEELKGIGKGLAGKITTLVRTGQLPYYEELRRSFPEGLLALLRIPELGPKRLRVLHEKLGIDGVEALRAACEAGKLAALEGFGEKSQQKLLKGLEALSGYQGRFLYSAAAADARTLLESLEREKAVQKLEVAGSLRRRRETIGDIDLVVASTRPAPVMRRFVEGAEVKEVIARGETKSSVRLESGIQADLRVVKPGEYPFALHYFTGSKDHDIAMRERARQRGLKLNEYGLFQGKKRLACASEEGLFERLGLVYIPPELREDLGELEEAEKGKAFELVQEKDLRGTFHCHTTYSDGTCSLEQLAEAARARGWEYAGVADHSRSATYVNGLKTKQLRQQMREIDRLNRKWKDFRLLKGIESDILADGGLDYPDGVLRELDYVIVAVHSRFGMPREEMTARIIRAVRHPCAHMLAHPTGRLLLSREPYALDLHAVLDAAADSGTVVELNAHPQRLDLDWRLGPYARKQGLRVAIVPDSHSVEGLDDVFYGVGIARKAGFRKGDVLNTLPWQRLRAWLKGTGPD